MLAGYDIKQYLEELAQNRPHIVQTKLERGSLVPKSWGLSYEIDDPEIFQRLGNFPEGMVPYGQIYRALTSSMGRIWQLFDQEGIEMDGREVLPFSRVFESKLGECLEKAVLVQLSAQKGRDSFLISGLLGEDDGTRWYHGGGFSKDLNWYTQRLRGGMYHGFNIVFKNGEPHLVDAQNPLVEDSNGKIHPYIAPIIGINSAGEIQVPREWQKNRVYALY